MSIAQLRRLSSCQTIHPSSCFSETWNADIRLYSQYCIFNKIIMKACWTIHAAYSQLKTSVHDKLHELHSHFPQIAQRTPSIITSSCWKSTVSDITASATDRRKGHVQKVTCLLALTFRNLYDYKTKEYVDVLTSQSSSLWFQHQNLLYLFFKL